MNAASAAGALAAALIAGAGAAEPSAAAGAVRVVDRTAGFPSGPYVALAVDPHDSMRLAVTTADGRVAWTDDDGDTVDEALVVAPREYLSAPLRTQPSRLMLTSQRSGSRLQLSGLVGERPGMRLFLWLLKERRPVARWQYWMAIENPATEIADVTVPARGRPALAATASGLFLSDPRHAGWIAVAGAPTPRAATLTALAVTVDPEDPAHVLAGTPAGPLRLARRRAYVRPAPERGPRRGGVSPLLLGSGDGRPPAGDRVGRRLSVARRGRQLRALV